MQTIQTLRDNLTAGRVAQSRREFVESLLSQFVRRGSNEGSLSSSQWYWVNRINTECASGASTAPRVASGNAQWADGARTVHGWLLTASASGLQRPAVRYPNSVMFKLPASTSRHAAADTFFVMVGAAGSRVYAGRFTNGLFYASREVPSNIAALLSEIMANPLQRAIEVGRTTGNCCFCARDLTDERSTSVGYGPICAGHYGLPWGAPEAAAVRRAAQRPARTVDLSGAIRLSPLPTPAAPALPNVASFEQGGPDSEDRAFF
jgi:hypothetical protein